MWTFDMPGDGLYVCYPATYNGETRYTNESYHSDFDPQAGGWYYVSRWTGIGDGAGLRVWMRAELDAAQAVFKLDVQVKNEGASRVEWLRLVLPKVLPDEAYNANWRIYGPDKYGGNGPWPTNGQLFAHETWPGGLAPLYQFYNQTTGKGVGALAWDDDLHEMGFAGRSYNDRAEPQIQWAVRLDPGETAQCYVELRVYPEGAIPQFRGSGVPLPSDHWRYFRHVFLKPYLQSRGIAERDATAWRGVWGNVTETPNPLTETQEMLNTYPQLKAANIWFNGAIAAYGFYQARPSLWMYLADGTDVRASYEPYFQLIDDAAALIPMGVTVDLGIRSDTHNAPTGNDVWINMSDPVYRAQNRQQLADLVARGCQLAFWDLGFSVARNDGKAFLHELVAWQKDGISLMPEGTSGLGLWTTGITLAFPYYMDEWGVDWDSAMVKVLYPKACYVVLDPRDEDVWSDHALARGLSPMFKRTALIDFAAG